MGIVSVIYFCLLCSMFRLGVVLIIICSVCRFGLVVRIVGIIMDIVVSVSSGIVMGWCVIVGSLIVIMVSSMMVDVIVKSVVCELGMVLLF